MKSIYSSLAILLSGWSACGQSYQLDWFTIEAGGTGSSGGNFALVGLVGQPDAGALAGGGYVIFGGYLNAAGASGQVQPSAVLQARVVGPGAIALSWPAALSGYSLQQSTAIQGPQTWSSVAASPSIFGGEYYVTLPIDTRVRFYRLIQP